MNVFTIDLYHYFGVKRYNTDGGFLTCIITENIGMINPTRKYPAMIVVPGGAYGGICEREGDPVAIRYSAAGYQAFVLRYSYGGNAYPHAFRELAMAVIYVRENADKFHISEKVAVTGFSAGGHLAGAMAVCGCRIGEILNGIRNNGLADIDAAVLCYPVTDISGKYAHETTSKNLCGENEHLKKELDLHHLVHNDSVPLFVWHTWEDQLVVVENSLLLMQEYRRRRLSFAFHCFEKGRHGQATGEIDTWHSLAIEGLSAECRRWFGMATEWLAGHGFTIED